MKPRLLIATLNSGKLREFAEALAGEDIEVYGLDDLEAAVEPVDETGTTFEANARLKAEAYSQIVDDWVLADDSGLEVDALRGAPGVHSARYGGDGLDDEDRLNLVLARMGDVRDPERRTARFRCVLALARQGETQATFDGVIEGRILEQPRGTNGFGYDPIFFHPESGCTTAELSMAEKRRVSHRGQAIQAFLEAVSAGSSPLVTR